ncbi:ABC transporter ATP-binding protein [Rhizobium halophilum]|jgi:peptide/nickel transport system ATP-binding protein|uniref:ABC transporter ATP-binding protein n=1 Tax=Rhizobium halophilum TaxID=2846852 RepID=UPI001EFE3C5F|nr:ABC transporter ATP-binding protein [Rhizobium halophilum]MCF6369642.1 ATP-binding cassette domain-containing protein [Rhizobium halophilum]HEV7433852.1 ABC transporter ATP-binding protein [Pseudorhizobium sp.]
MTEALLDVRDLRLGVVQKRATLHAILKGVSFQILPGEAYGLVGESGSGKSVTSLAIMGLLGKPLSVTGGALLFKGQNLLDLSKREMRRLRGNRIAMIFQEPMTALNPLATVGRQIAEMYMLHQGKGRQEAQELAIEALASVRVPNPDRRAKDYPHQMSGGLRQRVMIAMALACDPDLLIADEPTTALDVTVQAEVLRLIKDLCAERGTAVLFISHDLGVIASICQRVGVMYAGCLVEENETKALFQDPRHEYTRGLLGALPQLGSRSQNGRRRLVDIDSIIADRSKLTETSFIVPRRPQGGQA